MPDLICDDLIIRILHDKADLSRLHRCIHPLQSLAAKQDLTAALAVGGQHGL